MAGPLDGKEPRESATGRKQGDRFRVHLRWQKEPNHLSPEISAAGGRDGDLYLNVALHPHRLFRVSGHDLFFDLPLAPWEAVLGTTIETPTPGGKVMLKVPPGTQAGQQLRLAKRGLPKPRGGEGDLFAIVQIVVPSATSERERALYRQLAEGSTYNPRAHFAKGG